MAKGIELHDISENCSNELHDTVISVQDQHRHENPYANKDDLGTVKSTFFGIFVMKWYLTNRLFYAQKTAKKSTYSTFTLIRLGFLYFAIEIIFSLEVALAVPILLKLKVPEA